MTKRLVVADRIRIGSSLPGDALLIGDGRVVAVGRAADLRRPELLEDRFPGSVITPGLRDAHMHPVPYAMSLTRPTLKEASDLDEALTRIRDGAALLPAGVPLIAIRLDDEGLQERRLPTRRELDLAVDDRPVLVYRYCGHIAVANTLALATAGVASVATDPIGGSLDRDEFGVPNGILRETAIERVATALSGRSSDPNPEDVLAAMHGLVGLGITSLGAILAVGTGPWCDTGNELRAMLAIADRLPLKVSVLVIAGDSAELEQAAADLRATVPACDFSDSRNSPTGAWAVIRQPCSTPTRISPTSTARCVSTTPRSELEPGRPSVSAVRSRSMQSATWPMPGCSICSTSCWRRAPTRPICGSNTPRSSTPG